MSDPHLAFFSRWSRFYESTPVLGRILRSQQTAAVERLNPQPEERILDLGCGPGLGMKALTRSGARVVGLDYSGEMLGGARPYGPVMRASALAIPLASGSIDGILCTNSFHHYPEPLSTLREMHRVLKPGGRIALVDPNLDHPISRLIIYGGEAIVFGMGVHLHSPAEWRTLLHDAGFNSAYVEPLVPQAIRWLVELPSVKRQLTRVPGLANLADPLAASLCAMAWA